MPWYLILFIVMLPLVTVGAIFGSIYVLRRILPKVDMSKVDTPYKIINNANVMWGTWGGHNSVTMVPKDPAAYNKAMMPNTHSPKSAEKQKDPKE